jgi:hypothetical protein
LPFRIQTCYHNTISVWCDVNMTLNSSAAEFNFTFSQYESCIKLMLLLIEYKYNQPPNCLWDIKLFSFVFSSIVADNMNYHYQIYWNLKLILFERCSYDERQFSICCTTIKAIVSIYCKVQLSLLGLGYC